MEREKPEMRFMELELEMLLRRRRKLISQREQYKGWREAEDELEEVICQKFNVYAKDVILTDSGGYYRVEDVERVAGEVEKLLNRNEVREALRKALFQDYDLDQCKKLINGLRMQVDMHLKKYKERAL